MSSNPDSVSCRSFSDRLTNNSEPFRNHNNNNVTFYDSTSNKSSTGISSGNKIATIVTATSSSSNSNNVITSVLGSSSANGNQNIAQTSSGKKHSIGYQLRRWFRNTTGSVGKHRSQKDVENGNASGDNQNFIRHTASLYSTSSGESEHHSRILGSKRKSHRYRSAQSNNNNDEINVIPNEFTNFFTGNKKKSRENQNNNITTTSTSTVTGTTTSSTSHHSSNTAFEHGTISPNLTDKDSFECPICLLEQPVSNFPELLTCNHRVCLNCLKQYLKIEICESRILLTCTQCVELLHPNDIQNILISEPKLLEKYETFMIRRYLITEPDARWCPAPDCNYCVIATGCASCPKLQCGKKSCETLFCYHCKQHWHAHQTCDEARQTRYRTFTGTNSRYSSSREHRNYGARNSNASTPDGPFNSEDMKPCPCCKVLIVKMDDGSCNHMTCSVCGTEFCWLCMQKISDLHYLSPSGCTFWGKKPWSRKKKIMWQLGMLVGAPVGIALIAGIAVPAIIIGIPVWVGRKLHARFERSLMSRAKSNFLVTTGIVTSVFVSPILAAVAVGIGVPILLAYVYGVVPISLCRSGGCGVSTSSSGVKFDMDDDEISTNGVHADGFSIDTALSGHGRPITNPSIGEMSLGLSASLSIGSNSHLDRLTTGGCDTQIDRESSSIQACAGSIASAGTLHILPNYGSANGQTMTSLSGTSVSIASIGQQQQQQQLQQQAVFSPQNSSTIPVSAAFSQNTNGETNRCLEKRSSLCSTNADTLSFGDQRSINTNLSSVDGDASLKALNGSLRDGNSTLSPIEVHVNIEENHDNEEAVNITDTSGENNKISNPSNTVPTSLIAPTANNYSIYHNNMIDDDDDQSDIISASGKLSTQLGKFESRSLEYLSNNFCKLCHRSHRPCCPNFQHRLKRNIDDATAPSTTSARTKTPVTKLCDDNENHKNNASSDKESNCDASLNEHSNENSNDNSIKLDEKTCKNQQNINESVCDVFCFHQSEVSSSDQRQDMIISSPSSDHYPYSDLREARQRNFTGSFDSAFTGIRQNNQRTGTPVPWSSTNDSCTIDIDEQIKY